jgi:DNA-binding response OmpR family regulator
MANVLIVEDEQPLLQTLRYNLTQAGHEVRLCADGVRALEMVRENPPDLMLLDLMLPGMNGLEVCRHIRREVVRPAVRRVPILVLTARDAEIDKVVGLEVGADDYMTKPFSMHELLARVKALLRRAELAAGPQESFLFRSGDVEVDLAAHRALHGGKPLHLKPREFDLLAYFLRHIGQVLTRERLLRNVWGHEFAGDTGTVDVHVRWLRGEIEPNPMAPTRIQTVCGVGYLFTG